MTSEQIILLDTNILIHLVRNNRLSQSIESRFRLRSRIERPLVCVVTVGEILSFAKRLNWGATKMKALEDLLRELALLDIHSEEVLSKYAEVDFFLRRKGRTIEQNDIWIAATAIVAGAQLLTTDKDFDPLHPTHLDRIWIDPQQPAA